MLLSLSVIPCEEKSLIRWLFQSASEYVVLPPISNCMDLPLSEGELTPCLFDHVVCGPLGEHPEQMPYPGGNRAYPVHPPLLCRLGIVLPWAATVVVFDVDDDIDVDVDVEVDVGVEVEPGFR